MVRKYSAALGPPVFAVILAMIAGAIVILITWPDKRVDPFTNILNAYSALFTGSFGSLTSISDTLVRVTPLIFASISVAIAFRAGLFNIGAAGQLAVGAMAADIIGLTFTSWPSWVLIPTMLLASILAGAIWGGIAGFLKAWRGAHEVVTTIMLNWIAFYGTDYLINSAPFTAPFGVTQTTALPPNATLPPIVGVYTSNGHRRWFRRSGRFNELDGATWIQFNCYRFQRPTHGIRCHCSCAAWPDDRDRYPSGFAPHRRTAIWKYCHAVTCSCRS